MSESDRATLLHAAELLEGKAIAYKWAPVDDCPMCAANQDLIATARALREMAG